MLKVPPEPRNVWGVCGYMTYRVLYYSNQIIPVSTLVSRVTNTLFCHRAVANRPADILSGLG
jgi:uncharacterized membrane protein